MGFWIFYAGDGSADSGYDGFIGKDFRKSLERRLTGYMDTGRRVSMKNKRDLGIRASLLRKALVCQQTYNDSGYGNCFGVCFSEGNNCVRECWGVCVHCSASFHWNVVVTERELKRFDGMGEWKRAEIIKIIHRPGKKHSAVDQQSTDRRRPQL